MIQITKSLIETYHLRGGQLGWADITLGSKSNSIDIKSDWGNYSTAFNSPGANFKKFLTDLGEDYLIGRFQPPKHLDWPRTLKAIRKDIRELSLDKEDARECFEQLDGIKPTSVVDLYSKCWTGALAKHVYLDPYLPVVMEVDGKWKGFMKYVWPEFVKELKRELKSDRSQD